MQVPDPNRAVMGCSIDGRSSGCSCSPLSEAPLQRRRFETVQAADELLTAVVCARLQALAARLRQVQVTIFDDQSMLPHAKWPPRDCAAAFLHNYFFELCLLSVLHHIRPTSHHP